METECEQDRSDVSEAINEWRDGSIDAVDCIHALEDELSVAQRDAAALDRIHKLLDGALWDAGTIESVAEMVTATGRAINPPDPLQPGAAA